MKALQGVEGQVVWADEPSPTCDVGQVRIRVAARALGIEKVEAGEGRALITFATSTPVDPGRLVAAVQASRGRLRFKREFTLEAAVARGEWPQVRDSILETLAELGRA